MILIILNMEHFQSKENQQNYLLTSEDALNKSSGNDERVFGKYFLFD